MKIDYFTINLVSYFRQLWQPNLLFEDQFQSEAQNTRQWSELSVLMQSDPLEDDITRVREGDTLMITIM